MNTITKSSLKGLLILNILHFTLNISENLRTTTQKGNMETRQMTPFLSSTFSAVCNIHF